MLVALPKEELPSRDSSYETEEEDQPLSRVSSASSGSSGSSGRQSPYSRPGSPESAMEIDLPGSPTNGGPARLNRRAGRGRACRQIAQQGPSPPQYEQAVY